MPQAENYEEVVIDRELAEGETAVFEFTDAAGLVSDGLVINYGGNLHAFRNLCRHQPRPLDYGDEEFMDISGRYIECRHHAALFEPDSGFCVSGPCAGASLFKYPVSIVDGKIVVRIPQEEIDLE